MTDKPLVLEIPEELLQFAEATHLDLRQTIIEMLEQKRQVVMQSSPLNTTSALRELGYLAGQVHISADFDDDLPESFWLGDSA